MMRGRLLSVVGDSSSVGPMDDNGRIEVARKASQALLRQIEDRESTGFANFYRLGREIGQGMHASAHVCHKRPLVSSAGIKPGAGKSSVISEEQLEQSDSDDEIQEKSSESREASTTSAADNANCYVVKVTRTDEEQVRDAESREYDLLREIDHPNIVKAHAYFPDEQMGPHLVLEFVDGEELPKYIAKLAKEAYTEQAARALFRQVLEAIAHLHGR